MAAKKSKPKAKSKKSKSSFFKSKFWKIVKYTFLSLFLFSILLPLTYRWINPPVTPLMLIRKFSDGSEIRHQWVDMKNISPHLVTAAVAAEDGHFLTHNGFDFKAMQKAQDANKKGKKLRGASTISQQVAKNVFLYPKRSYFRKTLEGYFTVLIELFWSKERIMEVYLNVIETGKGMYGCEAAAQTYFNTSAKNLTAAQAALLTTIYPDPRKRNPAKPSAYLKLYQANILKNMANVGKISFTPEAIKKAKERAEKQKVKGK